MRLPRREEQNGAGCLRESIRRDASSRKKNGERGCKGENRSRRKQGGEKRFVRAGKWRAQAGIECTRSNACVTGDTAWLSRSAVIGYAISRWIVPNTEMRIFRVFRGGTAGNQDHPPSPVRGKRSINQSFRGDGTRYYPGFRWQDLL